MTDFIFLGSKITDDGDCNHEIKGHLLLGRKAMTKLYSIFKRRDITVVLEKTLEGLLEARKSNQSILKEIFLEYSLEELTRKPKFQYFGHLI